MKKILSTAHSQNAASIAIPAIGTGLLAIPEQLVAKIMFEEVANFSKDNPTSKLNDVRFVIFDKNDNIFKVSVFFSDYNLFYFSCSNCLILYTT